MLTKKGRNIFVEHTEKNATWWNGCKCTRKPKVTYTMQNNCYYYSKGWMLPLYNGQGCNKHTQNKLPQIGSIPLHTLLIQRELEVLPPGRGLTQSYKNFGGATQRCDGGPYPALPTQPAQHSVPIFLTMNTTGRSRVPTLPCDQSTNQCLDVLHILPLIPHQRKHNRKTGLQHCQSILPTSGMSRSPNAVSHKDTNPKCSRAILLQQHLQPPK